MLLSPLEARLNCLKEEYLIMLLSNRIVHFCIDLQKQIFMLFCRLIMSLELEVDLQLFMLYINWVCITTTLFLP